MGGAVAPLGHPLVPPRAKNKPKPGSVPYYMTQETTTKTYSIFLELLFRAPLNKHLQATNQVRKGLLEAGAMRQGLSETLLQQQIKEACSSKEYVFARQMLGHTIFSGLKGKQICSTIDQRGRAILPEKLVPIIPQILVDFRVIIP